MIITIVGILLAIVILLGILMAWLAWRSKKEGIQLAPDYRIFYIMGIVFVALSIVAMVIFFILQIPFYVMIPLGILGLIYLVIGLSNRGK